MRAQEKRIIDFRLFKQDNNIDGKDNLDEVPASPAVYAIFGRINGEPANCRYVGESENLRNSIKKHFSDSEENDCLKEFMQSIKIKTMNFELLEAVSDSERVEKKNLWEDEFKPNCTKELNEVF